MATVHCVASQIAEQTPQHTGHRIVVVPKLQLAYSISARSVKGKAATKLCFARGL